MTTAISTPSERETTPATRPRGRRVEPGASAGLTRAVALAALAALLVLVAGGASLLSRGTTYEASLDLLVTPSSGASDLDAAALFDTLSKGQVAATVAEIYRQHRWLGDRSGSIEAGVVTPSAVVHVSARASSATAAEELVQAVVAAADPTVERALDPYRVSRLDSQAPSAVSVGMSRGLRLVLALLAALVVGGAVLRFTYPKSTSTA